MLDALEAASIAGSFFLQGRWVEAHPDLARRIARGGHLVGSHSHYHVRMPLLSDSGFATDVRAAESVIRRVTGADPRPWFRLPFGSGARHGRLIAALGRLGYRHVGWHVEVREWRARETSASVADRIVSESVDCGDGAIVLLHAWPDILAEALPAATSRLIDAGVTFVRVDQLELPDDLSPIGEPQPQADPAAAR